MSEKAIKQQELPGWLFSSPLLIYGPRKGGTTLLQNLHDGSPSIFVYPTELKLKYLGNMLWNFEAGPALERYLEIYNVKDM